MLTFDQRDYRLLRRQGEESYPREGCGVLLGLAESGELRVHRVVACRNAHGDRLEDRYTIDPRELVAIQRRAREQRLEIIGFYHSHPDHPAHWSQTDLAEAHWIGCVYVITAVRKGRAAETNAFLLAGSLEEDKHFQPESIRVVGESIFQARAQEAQWPQ